MSENRRNREQNRKNQAEKFLKRATRSSLEIIELSLHLYLYYRGIYEEDLFRSVRRFRKRSYSTLFYITCKLVNLWQSVIIKECISEDIINYVNQALKPAEEFIRKGQLKGVHCVISHLDGPEIERLCFEIENPIKLEGSARYFRNLNPGKKDRIRLKIINFRWNGERISEVSDEISGRSRR